ncbi:hypothetical protein NR798_04055 [Archangium gephyra]|uniref:hypothetical protein n=1 Tax=Archangium gephyra TaxID=48 RepID=UPI0035D49512
MMKRAMRWTVVTAALVLGGCGGAGMEEPGAPEQAAPQETSGGTVQAQSCPATSDVKTTTGCMNYDGWKQYSFTYCQSFGSRCVASSTSPYSSCGGDLYGSAVITCISY